MTATLNLTVERFCPLCEVSLDLHPWPGDAADPGCHVALAKADLLDRFAGIGRHP